MILSDKTLLRMLEEKTLTVEPLERGQVQPASIDIRLGNTFCVVEDSPTGILELDKEIRYKTITADTYILLPNQFVLATTMEYLRLPDTLTAFVEGRSSLGRLGLFIQNAGWVDPGFEGEITLELYNANRCAIALRAGRRVGQLVFARTDDRVLRPYAGKYQRQTDRLQGLFGRGPAVRTRIVRLKRNPSRGDARRKVQKRRRHRRLSPASGNGKQQRKGLCP